jgi:uncharacterized protein YeaO (DUF488 family)
LKRGSSADSGRREATRRASTEAVSLKRAYEENRPDDGIRVLVDRLWPRGLRKDQLAIDFWLKELAPSDRLRRWYGHRARRWPSFAAKYRNELAKRAALLRLLDQLRCRGRLTLLYGARDTLRNHAVVLREVLEERRWAVPRANEKRPEASAAP